MQKEIAKEYGISSIMVCILLNKALKKPKLLEELISERDLKAGKRHQIQEFVTELNDNNTFIDSAAMVVQKMNEDTDAVVKQREVIDVMKNDMGMSFRKVKAVSIHCNSTKNLVLRQ